MSVSAAYNAALGSGSVSAEIKEFLSKTSSETTLMFTVVRTTRQAAVADTRLRSFSLGTCGTHFVSRILYGGSIQLMGYEAMTQVEKVDEKRAGFEVKQQGGEGKGQLDSYTRTFANSDRLSVQVRSRGLTGTPRLLAKGADGVFDNIVTAVTELTAINSKYINPGENVAAIELTPYSSLEATGEEVGLLLAWIDRLAAISRAKQNPGHYEDSGQLIPGSATTKLDAQADRIDATVKQALDDIRSRRPTRLTLPRGVIPAAGEVNKDDVASHSGALQPLCKAEDSPTLFRMKGDWKSGINHPRIRCENIANQDGFGMACIGSGVILDLSEKDSTIWLLAPGAAASVRFSDSGDYSDNQDTLVYSCRPYLDPDNQREQTLKAAACESRATEKTAGVRCISVIK